MATPRKLPNLYYVGLEAYESRYTLQLTEWNKIEMRRIPGLLTKGIHFIEIKGLAEPANKVNKIKVGAVLDAFGRPKYAMAQIANLLDVLASGKAQSSDVIFFEDMFHPGIEALAYAMAQMPSSQRPKVVVRCLAQTIDPDDFVHYTGMFDWMRKYEEMVLGFVDAILVASHEMASHFTIAGWGATSNTKRPTIFVTGLPFSKTEVQTRLGKEELIRPFSSRPQQVVFASRLDSEKQPEFFLELARRVKANNPEVSFVIASGTELKSNSNQALHEIREAERNGLIQVKTNLSKLAYYQVLNQSRVLFNCALQDWVSNTVSEADALGCNTLFPAYRSFPEVFGSDPTRLYIPWSLTDAHNKLLTLLQEPHLKLGEISSYQSKTVSRSIRAMFGRSLPGAIYNKTAYVSEVDAGGNNNDRGTLVYNTWEGRGDA